MVFTTEDYKKIERWLLSNSKKDTDFPEATTPLSGDEIVAIVQNEKNVTIPVQSLLEQIELLDKFDFINATERYGIPPSPLTEVAASIPLDKRQLGGVISFLDEHAKWRIFQFVGWNLDQWQDINQWKDIEEIVLPTIQHNLTLGDEEDLTTEKVDETPELVTYQIKLKNKKYSKEDFSGLGRVWLRKNLISDPGDSNNKSIGNFLTQEMIQDESTVYYIQYDYSIPTGVNLQIPNNSVLFFIGGSIQGSGSVTYNNTFLAGNPIIGARVGEVSSIINTEVKVSWFTNVVAEDLFQLSSQYNTIVVDTSITLTDSLTICGGINCVGGSRLNFTGDSSKIYDSLVTLSEISNEKVPRNLTILSTAANVQCGVKIQQTDINVVLPHTINIQGVRTTSLTTIKGVVIESSSSQGVFAQISGYIWNLNSANTTTTKVIGLEINIPYTNNKYGNVIIDDLHIGNINGGNVVANINKDNIIGIYANVASPNAQVTIKNVKLDNLHGVGILTEGSNIIIDNVNIDMYGSVTNTLPICGIKVLSSFTSIKNCNIYSSRNIVIVSDYNSIAIKLAGSNNVIENTVITHTQANYGNMIVLDNAQNFNINAFLIYTSSDTNTKNAIQSIGDSYGKLVLSCKLPKCTLMNINNVNGILDATVLGEVGTAFTITASPALGVSARNIIHDCHLTCTDFIQVTAPGVINNLDLIDNVIYGKTLLNISQILMYSNLKGNILTIPTGSLTSDGKSVISADTIVYGQIQGNIITCLDTTGSLPVIDFKYGVSSGVTDNIITYNNGVCIKIGKTHSASIVANNKLFSTDAISGDSTASGITIQDNIIQNQDMGTHNLNPDGTDKSKVTIL